LIRFGTAQDAGEATSREPAGRALVVAWSQKMFFKAELSDLFHRLARGRSDRICSKMEYFPGFI